MVRLYVVCEGETEVTFVKAILEPSLRNRGADVYPVLIGKPGHKGGRVNFDRLRKDVKTLLKRERKAFCTVFIDYYGLNSKFPGKAEASGLANAMQKHEAVCSAMVESMRNDLGGDAIRRFIPHVTMHEFEGLLFSDPIQLAAGLYRPDCQTALMNIRNAFPSPEDIDDGPQTAPGKRILGIVPEYEKPLYGVLAALETGLDAIRQECPIFNGWLTRLEALAEP